MLLPRLLTALVGIPLVLWLIHAGSLPYLVFVLGITALALYEYVLILRLGRLPVQAATVGLGGMALAVGLAAGSRLGPAGSGLPAAALTLTLAAALVSELFRSERSLDRVALTVLGVLLIGWCLPHLQLLRALRPRGEALTWLLFLTVWATDTAAYAAGRAWGRRRLSPVSPKKTWEGAVAGLAGGLAAAVAVGSFFALPLPLSAGAGLLVGTVGQASDLAESLVKRAAGVKDSGALLPGHGGVLDRFDSFLLAAPLLYYLSGGAFA